MEFAVLPSSALVGRSATDIRLRTRLGIDLLAVSRQGRGARRADCEPWRPARATCC